MKFVRCDVSFSRSWRCSCRFRSTITRQLASELPHSCCSILLHQNWIVTKVFEDGSLRGTCPIMLGNNVSYDCKTNLEIKGTPIK